MEDLAIRKFVQRLADAKQFQLSKSNAADNKINVHFLLSQVWLSVEWCNVDALDKKLMRYVFSWVPAVKRN